MKTETSNAFSERETSFSPAFSLNGILDREKVFTLEAFGFFSG